MSKILFYDLETTGLDNQKNGIHQLSGIVDIDGCVLERFNFKVKPFNSDIIEDAALEIAGVTREDIKSYMPAGDCKKQLDSIVARYVNKYDKADKLHLAGYNCASFNNQFLRQFYTKNGDKYFGSNFWSDTLDVMVLASYKLQNHRSKMENFQLKTVARTVGIDVDESRLHDALYDVELTRAIYYKLFFKKDV